MAYMYLTIFDSVSKAAAPGLTIEPDSLYSAFLPGDGWTQAERQTLSVTVIADEARARKTGRRNDGQWHRGLDQRSQGWLREQLDWPKRFPTNSPLSSALAHCDAEQIVTVIANVLLKARAVEQAENEPSWRPPPYCSVMQSRCASRGLWHTKSP